MQIYIDPNNIFQVLQGNPFKVYARLFMEGGWLVLLISLIWGFYFAWIYLQRRKWIKTIDYTLLAIDVPKDNEKSVQAVEELFNTLHGIISTKTEWEKKILGRMQLWYSLEIVSIEGYIQFLIRTPSAEIELVKSAVYAQYPDAELTEVEDYMSLIPQDADEEDSKYSAWGMDYYLGRQNYLPLKTYPNFEHSMTQTFIDPLASILEVMSKLAPGEFIGIMMMVQPVKDKQIPLNDNGQRAIDKLMGRKSTVSKNLVDKTMDTVMEGVNWASETVYQLWDEIDDQAQDERAMLKMLTPDERAKIMAIESKMGKIKYRVKMKSCYVAPKDRYSRARGYHGMQGAFKQFDGFNRLKAVKTKAKYFITKKRRYWKIRRFLRRYTERDFFESREFILAVDEVASLYHFPQMDVMAPLIKKAETKTVEPPTGLPLEEKVDSELFTDAQERKIIQEQKELEKKIQNEEVIDLNLDNKQFESQFAKDQKEKKEFEKEFEKEDKEKDKKPPANLPTSKKISNKKVDKEEKKEKTKSAPNSHPSPPSNLPFID